MECIQRGRIDFLVRQTWHGRIHSTVKCNICKILFIFYVTGVVLRWKVIGEMIGWLGSSTEECSHGKPKGLGSNVYKLQLEIRKSVRERITHIISMHHSNSLNITTQCAWHYIHTNMVYVNNIITSVQAIPHVQRNRQFYSLQWNDIPSNLLCNYVQHVRVSSV